MVLVFISLCVFASARVLGGIIVCLCVWGSLDASPVEQRAVGVFLTLVNCDYGKTPLFLYLRTFCKFVIFFREGCYPFYVVQNLANKLWLGEGDLTAFVCVRKPQLVGN